MALADARWSAVTGRHAQSDGVFVYAVRSTGVFCRPTCPARRPMRRNVEFYATPEQARHAGFRPCRRCHPDSTELRNPAAAKVIRACRLLEEPDVTPGLAELARALEWSPDHLQRTFRRWVGVSPRQYAQAVRTERVKTALRDGGQVTAAVYGAGYGSTRAFYETASLRLGMDPSTYGAGGTGSEVRYTITPSCVGLVLLAATETGLCAVKVGDGEAALLDDLKRELPRSDMRRADEELADVAATVREITEGHPPGRDLPLDVTGTAFQARVWEALRRIPPGTIRSYTEVAGDIGSPSAVRAVANACGANPVALVVPCHRVVRSNGALGGYRWGIEVKAELLRREAAGTATGTPAETVTTTADIGRSVGSGRGATVPRSRRRADAPGLLGGQPEPS